MRIITQDVIIFQFFCFIFFRISRLLCQPLNYEKTSGLWSLSYEVIEETHHWPERTNERKHMKEWTCFQDKFKGKEIDLRNHWIKLQANDCDTWGQFKKKINPIISRYGKCCPTNSTSLEILLSSAQLISRYYKREIPLNVWRW